jgi:hypothetical protein
VEVVPCSEDGKEYSEKDDVFVENPQDLLGKNIVFSVKVMNARGLPNKFTVSKLTLHV